MVVCLFLSLFTCQSSDAQRETASQTIDLIKVKCTCQLCLRFFRYHKDRGFLYSMRGRLCSSFCLNCFNTDVLLPLQYLMEFNSSPGDLMELSPLFSDDSRVAEAASIAEKLRKMTILPLG